MKRGTLVLTILFIALLISGRMLMDDQLPVSPPMAVELPAGDTWEQVFPWLSEEGSYYIFLPSYARLEEMTFSLDEDVSVTLDGHTLSDGMSCKDFQAGVPYELRYRMWGRTETLQLIFMQSENIAAMHIDTVSGNMDYIHSKKGNAEESTVRLYDAAGEILYRGASVRMKGRGNATWTEYDKKPYALQFPEEADLLQMGAAQNWILLANATDMTHMKNKLIYDFAEDLGLLYSPDSQWVDLYLNNEYVGLYLLTERNEIHSERVAIAQDGWLVSSEFEDRLVRQNYPYVSTEEGMALRIHEPDMLNADQQDSIKSYWQSIENAIMADDGIDPITGKLWTELIDLDSWVRRYLIEEIFANGDACAISQFYYTAELGGAAYAGPVWDEDYTLSPRGEWRLSYPNLLAARLKEPRSVWFYELYEKDEFYNHMVFLYETQVKAMLRTWMNETVLESAEIIREAAYMNQLRWDMPYGIDEELERCRGYLSDRIEFLDRLWIDDTEMVSVQIDSVYGVYRGNILIPVGTAVGHELVSPPVNEYLVFQGWCFADTGEPFDKDRVIYEDVGVYAKWEDSNNKKMGQVVKAFPLLVIAVLGVALLSKELCRNRKRM